MEKIKCYLDSSVILQIFSPINDNRIGRVVDLLKNSSRIFVVSDYVRLETIPKMRFNKNQEQIDFTETLFINADYVHSTKKIVNVAYRLAEEYGLAAMDALHAASAIVGDADELVTFEKPTKPFFRIPQEILKIVSLYE